MQDIEFNSGLCLVPVSQNLLPSADRGQLNQNEASKPNHSECVRGGCGEGGGGVNSLNLMAAIVGVIAGW
jgi:hypothetical protein